jgi:uncharacterized protein (TIGR04255 family)
LALELPVADNRLLPRSPLELVICQVRLAQLPEVGDASSALAVHRATGGEDGPFPQMEPVQLQTAQFSIGASVVTEGPSSGVGWQLRSEDGAWTAALMPDHIALTTTAYSGWADFRSRLESVIKAVAEVMHPVIENRLGLRYVDRIVRPEVVHSDDWAGLISDFMLGPVVHSSFAGHVRTSQQQLELDIDDGERAIIRHGSVVDPARQGRLSYLLDFDAFRERTREFSPEGILRTADVFNDICLRLFQLAITPELLADLRRPKD